MLSGADLSYKLYCDNELLKMLYNIQTHFTHFDLNQIVQGVKKFSLPIGLDAKVKIDLIVIGSVAVSPQGEIHIIFPRFALLSS